MSEHQMKEPLQKSTHKPRVSEQANPTTAEGAQDDLVRLQRLVGNQAVQRMLASKTIQAKMTVGAADDPFEREADAVASQVMAKRDIVQREAVEEEEPIQGKRVDIVQRVGGMEEEEPLQGKRVDIVQREGMEEEEPIQGKRVDIVQRVEEEEPLQGKRVDIVQRVEEEEPIQGKRVDIVQREGMEEEEPIQGKRVDVVQRENVDLSESFDVNEDVEQSIHAKSGSGQAIPDVHREMFESAMGRDFSGVNIHADSDADGLNKQVGARAFTTGSDIFFRQGEYNPASSGGQELLAHELTHVVQQGGAVQKKAEDEK